MINFHSMPPSDILAFQINKAKYRFQKIMAGLIFLLYFTVLMTLFYVISGCSPSPPPRLPNHYQSEPQSSKVIQKKFSAHAQGRLPVGLAIVANGDSSQGPLPFTEDSWTQFAARVQQKVQKLMPVIMQEVIRVEDISAGGKAPLIQGMGENSPIEMVLVVLPSSNEVRGPAQFDVLPEVGTLNGHQTENHSTVELGFLDVNSGKLLFQSQGTSHAMLDQLDIPLASNRYPRVRGSAMTSPIYPREEKALETLRIVAMDEALDQAAMKLAQKWPKGIGGSIPSGRPSQTGAES